MRKDVCVRKGVKKNISMLFCLVVVLSLVVPAFAEEPVAATASVDNSAAVTSTVITMQHTDVVVRAAPGTSSKKIGTQYIMRLHTLLHAYYSGN